MIREVPVHCGQYHFLDRDPEVEEKTTLAKSKEERGHAFTSSALDRGYKTVSFCLDFFDVFSQTIYHSNRNETRTASF